jgi:LPS export ABC transporter protein LptC
MYTLKHLFKSVMTMLFVLTLFSCEGNYKNVRKLNLKDNAPIAEGRNIDVKYTDSGKVVTNLLAPLLLDYSNFSFPYQEFPEGIEVRFWNEEQKKSIVTSDYAIRYDKTNIVDLRNNVVLITSDSMVLRAEQLYWDQKNKWVFTDRPYRIKFKDGSYNDGARFDSSEDFTNFLSRKNAGIQIIERNQSEDGE